MRQALQVTRKHSSNLHFYCLWVFLYFFNFFFRDGFTVTWSLVDFNCVLLDIDNVVVSVFPLSEDSQSFQSMCVLNHHHLVTSQSAVLVHHHQLVAAVADFLLVGHLWSRPHNHSVFQNQYQNQKNYFICCNGKSSLMWLTKNTFFFKTLKEQMDNRQYQAVACKMFCILSPFLRQTNVFYLLYDSDCARSHSNHGGDGIVSLWTKLCDLLDVNWMKKNKILSKWVCLAMCFLSKSVILRSPLSCAAGTDASVISSSSTGTHWGSTVSLTWICIRQDFKNPISYWIPCTASLLTWFKTTLFPWQADCGYTHCLPPRCLPLLSGNVCSSGAGSTPTWCCRQTHTEDTS